MNTNTNELPANKAGNLINTQKETNMNDRTTYFNNIKRIAILSFQDSRKGLIEWSYANKNILKNHIILSTARTANLLEGTLNSPVLNLEHGRSGGYQQVKALLQENKIDIILLFGSSALAEDRDSWFHKLIEVAIEQDVIVGYNQSTIDMLLNSISVRYEQEDGEFIHLLRNQVAKENQGLVNAK